MKTRSLGIILCLVIALPAWLLGRLYPIIGGPVFGILFGMLMTVYLTHSNQRYSSTITPGVQYTSKKILQFSIILLGFEMNLFHVFQVGRQSLLIIFFTLSTSFLVAYMMGKQLKLSKNMTTLIGVGTSICGGSAIAATAPVIRAKDEEVAQAISTIFLFNILAVFIFPPLGHLLHMSDLGFGMWAGTAINDTSSVVAAGTSWSAVSGNDIALNYATVVKLTRTLMIVPITLFLSLYTARHQTRTVNNHAHTDAQFHFSKVFPWFVFGFIGTAIISTFMPIPAPVTHLLSDIGKFFIVMAMVAIGLNTHLKKLLTSGLKPIFLGLCCWFSVACISLFVQYFMGLW